MEDGRMSHGGELYAVRDDMTSRPRFEFALRGYDKRQVDQYVAQTDSEISTLTAERERASGHIQDLTAQLQHLQAELTDLRQRPAQVDRASFRHLGPTVDQILALAEKQAEAITNTSAQRAANRQAEADKVLVEAREHAAQTLRDLEAEIAARHTDEEKTRDERRAAAQSELAEIRELADRLRADGEAARDRAAQEAKQINEQSAQRVEHARAEAEELVTAARAQVQQEVEAARAQAQQEFAQAHANVEREIDERRAAASQKIVALHAEVQQHAAEVRRRTDEQATAHQQQLTVVQEEIQARRQELAQLQTELDAAQQRLAESRQERATADHEVAQLQQRLGEVRQELTADLNRLDEARRAGDSAERHAKEVRARVQREAKRVADLAAAAVMAAAAGGADTGEYPRVMTVRSGADQTIEAPAGNTAADPGAPTNDSGHTGHDDAIPMQRGPQPEKVATDAE
jgi:chromosome segregation ATPase